MGRAPFQVLVLPFRRPRTSAHEYAIFRRADDKQWQGIAGGGEFDETPIAAAGRETAEEAGLLGPELFLYQLDCRDTVPANCFAAWPDWKAGTYVVAQYFFAIDATNRNIVISDEHLECVWLRYSDAYRLLRYDSNRTALWELDQRLQGDDLGQAIEVV